MAFSSRLVITCPSRSGSPRTAAPPIGATVLQRQPVARGAELRLLDRPPGPVRPDRSARAQRQLPRAEPRDIEEIIGQPRQPLPRLAQAGDLPFQHFGLQRAALLPPLQELQVAGQPGQRIPQLMAGDREEFVARPHRLLGFGPRGLLALRQDRQLLGVRSLGLAPRRHRDRAGDLPRDEIEEAAIRLIERATRADPRDQHAHPAHPGTVGQQRQQHGPLRRFRPGPARENTRPEALPPGR